MISGRDGTQLLEDVEKKKTAAVWSDSESEAAGGRCQWPGRDRHRRVAIGADDGASPLRRNVDLEA